MQALLYSLFLFSGNKYNIVKILYVGKIMR